MERSINIEQLMKEEVRSQLGRMMKMAAWFGAGFFFAAHLVLYFLYRDLRLIPAVIGVILLGAAIIVSYRRNRHDLDVTSMLVVNAVNIAHQFAVSLFIADALIGSIMAILIGLVFLSITASARAVWGHATAAGLLLISTVGLAKLGIVDQLTLQPLHYFGLQLLSSTVLLGIIVYLLIISRRIRDKYIGKLRTSAKKMESVLDLIAASGDPINEAIEILAEKLRAVNDGTNIQVELAENAEKTLQNIAEALAQSGVEVSDLINTSLHTIEDFGSIEKQSGKLNEIGVSLAMGFGRSNDMIGEITGSLNAMQNEIGQAENISKKVVEDVGAGSESLLKTIKVLTTLSDAMNQVDAKIELLNERSSAIDEILSTQKDIADQTNLLALNATIEAARAGEFGRGFSIVAAEVRILSDRAIQATEMISQVLNELRSDVSEASSAGARGKILARQGGQEADRASKEINGIRGGIDSLTGIVRSIAEGSRAHQETNNKMVVAVEQMTGLGIEMKNELTRLLDTVSHGVETMEGMKKKATNTAETIEQQKEIGMAITEAAAKITKISHENLETVGEIAASMNIVGDEIEALNSKVGKIDF